MSRLPYFLLSILLAGALGNSLPASAQVVLKPNGQNAIPLRVKALRADIAIAKQFATTKLTLTFLNETSDRIEADFIYTLPPDTRVTSFAYWYGDEKVPARIVEKEEAAAIYAHITARMRDPALVEMIGKNTFRARIFPVMPNSDLKVEMNLVQTLRSDAKGAHFTLPLQAKKGEPLDSVRVNVRVQPDSDIVGVTNSYGLPVKRTDDRQYQLTLSAKSYRPQKDLRVNLLRSVQRLHAALYAARSGGADGFFALALTPDVALTHPRVKIDGVTTYQVVPARLPGVKANRVLALFGRYKGSGTAHVTLTGAMAGRSWKASRSVQFSMRRERNNLATKLWAARRMEELGTDKRSRTAIIALSMRYGMPSKYTSWLAIPKAEMKRYKEERLQAQLEIVAERLAQAMVTGNGTDTQVKRLRSRLNELCRQTGANPDELLQGHLQESIGRIGQELTSLILRHLEASSRTKHIWAKLEQLRHRYGNGRNNFDSQNEIFVNLYSDMERLAAEISKSRHGLLLSASDKPYVVERTTPDPARARALLRALNRLAHISGYSASNSLAPPEYNWRLYEANLVRAKWQDERQKAQPDAQRIQRLEADFIARQSKVSDQNRAETLVKRLAARIDLEKVDQTLANPSKLDTQSLAELQKKRAELQKQEDELRARMGDPLLSIEAPADAQQVVALMPGGEIKRLAYDARKSCWEARFDIPSYATEGDYVITVIIVLKEGTRKTLVVRYHVDLTPPVGTGQARVAKSSQPMLRLELTGSPDTARVKALLPWGQEVELSQAAHSHRFFTLLPLTPEQRGTGSVVTYILTDKAHNRTTIRVDMTEN